MLAGRRNREEAMRRVLVGARPRIAIVRLGAIGDVVNTMPLACALRRGFPGAHLAWIVEPKALSVLEGHPVLDEILVFPRARWWRDGPAFARQLRSRHFELVLDPQRLLKSALVSLVTGARLRVGFDRARSKEGSSWLSSLHIPANAAPGVMVHQFLEFASFLDVPPAPPEWRVPITAEHRTAAEHHTASLGRSYVVVNLGASKPPNLWLPERFAELTRRLREQHGVAVLWTGGPQDRVMADSAAALEEPDLDLVGRTSLGVLAALLERARIVIACDTGPLHLAVAVGAPVVGLYGPADPGRTGPAGQPEGVVRPPGGSGAMAGIQVDAVLAAVARIAPRR